MSWFANSLGPSVSNLVKSYLPKTNLGSFIYFVKIGSERHGTTNNVRVVGNVLEKSEYFGKFNNPVYSVIEIK